MKHQPTYFLFSLLFITALFLPGCSTPTLTSSFRLERWLTNPAKEILFQSQPTLKATEPTNQLPVISIEADQPFQTMDGFGYTLTGGSAILLNRMSTKKRSALLQELFGTEGSNIGISYLRISIGASDLSNRVFSYSDLLEGETDPEMRRFSLDAERKDLIPILKEILGINPDIKIMGSPWSPPTWMKSNQHSRGGSLLPTYYRAYAHYFVRYVQEMKKEGVTIDAITVQNEPLHPGNNPSLLMLADEQAAFIKTALGPAFEETGITTKIIIYDHNADRPDYPISILNDPEARKYINGSAFHLYGGSIEALTEVHNAHPDKALYFTEQWVGAPENMAGDVAWHVKNLIIGASRNWARTVLEWNLAADPDQNPHTEGGCTQCLGAITIAPNGDITRNPAYYIIAHASKLVRPGSVRIASTLPKNLPNVAFLTPDKTKVLIVLNDSKAEKLFRIESGKQSYEVLLAAGAVETYQLN